MVFIVDKIIELIILRLLSPWAIVFLLLQEKGRL